METTLKSYPNRYGSFGGKPVYVIIRWTPQFLQSIKRRFGLEGFFSASDVAELFRSVFSSNAARLKLWRMYKQGWFVRNFKERIFHYTFSEGARKYCRYWMAFDSEDGPLIASAKPKYVDKIVEVRKEIVSTDRYLGEA